MAADLFILYAGWKSSVAHLEHLNDQFWGHICHWVGVLPSWNTVLYVHDCDPNRGAHSSSPASLLCSACVCALAQPLKYRADSNQILADVSGRQTDQWRLPVRGSDPGLSGSLAVHPPWRLRSVRAGGGWGWGGAIGGWREWVVGFLGEMKDWPMRRARAITSADRCWALFKFKRWCYTCQNKNNRLLIPLSGFKNQKECFSSPPIWGICSVLITNVINSDFLSRTSVTSIRNICNTVMCIHKSPPPPKKKNLSSGGTWALQRWGLASISQHGAPSCLCIPSITNQGVCMW